MRVRWKHVNGTAGSLCRVSTPLCRATRQSDRNECFSTYIQFHVSLALLVAAISCREAVGKARASSSDSGFLGADGFVCLHLVPGRLGGQGTSGLVPGIQTQHQAGVRLLFSQVLSLSDLSRHRMDPRRRPLEIARSMKLPLFSHGTYGSV
ncbi:hypothetical protein B0T22DRAFT_225507 [Podospora appendiculata]|uniref:Uncharacterized protein n=1 Tax=Podospora appendiculata TaxID=314037 RepID=A0AAE0X5L3_9PEZI|nr:hypothetical protein B0T22DRAFT_225507 [Podospora appendiculata]